MNTVDGDFGLKDCPFCGGTARLVQFTEHPYGRQFRVLCSDESSGAVRCRLHSVPRNEDGRRLGFTCRNDAISRWNTRADSRRANGR